MSGLCSGVETVPWICSCFVRLKMAEGQNAHEAEAGTNLGGGINLGAPARHKTVLNNGWRLAAVGRWRLVAVGGYRLVVLGGRP